MVKCLEFFLSNWFNLLLRDKKLLVNSTYTRVYCLRRGSSQLYCWPKLIINAVMATATLRVGPERSRNGLISVPHWEALCLACNEKLLCLLLLIFSGMMPSQWQKEPLHNVMPSAKELQRGCVALLCIKNNSFKTEGEVTVHGESGFFSCWRQMGWLRKCFHVLEKFIF